MCFLIGSTDGTTTTYNLTDAQGSVLMSLDSSGVLGEQIYGPYGNQHYSQGSMATDKGYTGQFHDAASGLDYYNARYYDPVMGQFLSADHVQGNAQGADPYSYVVGNPETNTDPTGNCLKPATAGLQPSCTSGGGGGGGKPTKGGPTQCPSNEHPSSNGGCVQNGPTASDCKKQGLTLEGGKCVYVPPACDAACKKKKAEEKARKDAQDAAADFQNMENWLLSGGIFSWIDPDILNLIGGISGITALFSDLAEIADIYAKGFAALANRPLSSFDCSLCIADGAGDGGMGDAAARLTARIVTTVLIVGTVGYALQLLGAAIIKQGGKLARRVGMAISILGVAGPIVTSYVAAGVWAGSWYFEDTYNSYLHQMENDEFDGGL